MNEWLGGNSNAAGCSYCQAQTIRAAERYSADQVQLDNIWAYKTHPAFSDDDRAALNFALASSVIPNVVDESIKTNLYNH
jgi:alkylhydroperoxidase family enzyme